jgi:hypothetical protein
MQVKREFAKNAWKNGKLTGTASKVVAEELRFAAPA